VLIGRSADWRGGTTSSREAWQRTAEGFVYHHKKKFFLKIFVD
jgi:hypothetical protein